MAGCQLRGLAAAIKRWSSAAQEYRRADYRGPLMAAGLYMLRSTDQNFRAGGRPTTWKPSQRAIKESGKTLMDKGYLRGSVISGTGRGSVWRFQGTKGLIIGTNIVYAAAHQFGIQKTVQQNVKAHVRKQRVFWGRIGKTRKVSVTSHSRQMRMNLPARPFLLFLAADVLFIREQFVKWLQKAFNGR